MRLRASYIVALLLGLIVLFSPFRSTAQETVTVKYFLATVHPNGDAMAHLQPWRLDNEAKIVMNSGLFIGYEKFIYQDLVSVKGIQGFLRDCSGGFASATHLGVRLNLMKTEKHRFYLGIGPTFIARNSWSRFEGYVSSGFFNEHNSPTFGDVQYKFIPYGAEIEYDYVFNEKNQLSVSFTPGLPIAGLVSVGWKHWFNMKDFGEWKFYQP